MSVFGSIIDQSQEYYSFNDGSLIILWCERTVNEFNWPVYCPAVPTHEKGPIECFQKNSFEETSLSGSLNKL